MFMQQRLGLKLAQKPILTQSLRQLVKLLALNKLELKEEISQELTENPVLELGAEGDSRETSFEDAVEATALRTGADTGPSPADSPETSESNGDAPDAFSEIDLGAFFDDYLDPGPSGPASEVIDKPSFETFLSKASTLTDHLLWQLSMTPAPEKILAAAEEIIGNIDEDGYFVSTVEEVAAAVGATEDETRQAVALVQELDPLGVGAADLQECLLLQLRAADAAEGVAGAIVRECWDELENGCRLDQVAARLGRPLRHVETAMSVVRGLDPRPGQRYAPSETRVVEPDVQFVQTPEGFAAVLDEDDLPELRLNRSYRNLLRRGEATADVRNYVRERYNSALQLLRNIEQRRQTIRSVCDVIAKRQVGFLGGGIEQMRPLMIKEVAEEIGVHPSTVSRAVSNKYAATPHGVYELRFFFSEGAQGPSGDAMPLMLLKRKVKKIIDEEDPRKPLTDDALSRLLRQDGVHVTRRTVAKYREDLNIPSTHKRRRKN